VTCTYKEEENNIFYFTLIKQAAPPCNHPIFLAG